MSIIFRKDFIKSNVTIDKHCECCLDNAITKDDFIEYKCVALRITKKRFDENLKNKRSKHDIKKFILLLQKVVYPYEYMDDCQKINETSLTEREDFTDADYTHKMSL